MPLVGLSGYTSRSMADSGTESNVDYDGPAQEVSEVKNIRSGLDTILVMFCQNLWLLFALVLKIYLKIN